MLWPQGRPARRRAPGLPTRRCCWGLGLAPAGVATRVRCRPGGWVGAEGRGGEGGQATAFAVQTVDRLAAPSSQPHTMPLPDRARARAGQRHRGMEPAARVGAPLAKAVGRARKATRTSHGRNLPKHADMTAAAHKAGSHPTPSPEHGQSRVALPSPPPPAFPKHRAPPHRRAMAALTTPVVQATGSDGVMSTQRRQEGTGGPAAGAIATAAPRGAQSTRGRSAQGWADCMLCCRIHAVLSCPRHGML